MTQASEVCSVASQLMSVCLYVCVCVCVCVCRIVYLWCHSCAYVPRPAAWCVILMMFLHIILQLINTSETCSNVGALSLSMLVSALCDF